MCRANDEIPLRPRCLLSSTRFPCHLREMMCVQPQVQCWHPHLHLLQALLTKALGLGASPLQDSWGGHHRLGTPFTHSRQPSFLGSVGQALKVPTLWLPLVLGGVSGGEGTFLTRIRLQMELHPSCPCPLTLSFSLGILCGPKEAVLLQERAVLILSRSS